MFEIGDRVRVNLPDTWVHNMTGTIAADDNSKILGVRFDEPNESFHDLYGHCEDKYGLWIERCCLEPLFDKYEIDAALDGELTLLL